MLHSVTVSSIVTLSFCVVIVSVSSFQSARFRLNHPSSQIPFSSSFIDAHDELGDANLNGGLGKENLLYVDDDIIVVDKPTLSQTAPGFRVKDSLATRIASLFRIDRVDKMVVHRLDYATSGVVVFVRNDMALSEMNKQFRSKGMNKIYKKYAAVVNGHINHACEGEIDLPLGRDMVRGPPLCCVDPEYGKPSITYWSLFERGNGRSHVHLFPQTGRTHQLRIHMASIGTIRYTNAKYTHKHTLIL